MTTWTEMLGRRLANYTSNIVARASCVRRSGPRSRVSATLPRKETRSWSSRSFVGVLLSVAAASTVIAGPSAARQLGSYNISHNRIFVAGFSSGGYMAVQMHVAFSSLFKGAAIYAGGPYDCARGSLMRAVTTCMENKPAVDVSSLERLTESRAGQGLIDPLDNLRGQAVYLWSGGLDTVVVQPLMDALESYYRNFQASVFQYDKSYDAEHGWESPYGSLPCDELASPFVVQCTDTDQKGEQILSMGGGITAGSSSTGSGSGTGFSPPGLPGTGSGSTRGSSWPTGTGTGSGLGTGTLGQTGSTAGAYDSEQVWLTQWFGNLNAKNQGTLKGGVITFDQNEFAPGDDASAISMDSSGHAFVPAQCANGQQCGLVLVLHGCVQNYITVGWDFIDNAGINEWADTNNILVLYPQTAAMDTNPLGCWDWWGYLKDPNYAQKSGPQMQALAAMVARAAGRKTP
jgi:poly(3-hydroxybutyrate) depolymerase